MSETQEICFDPGGVEIADVARLALDLWSDLGFDDAAIARLRRDGLVLDGVRLRGPFPYLIDSPDGRVIRVRVEDSAPAELLLDLGQAHFARGLRPGSIAA